MTTKEKLKSEIDKLPDELAKKVYKLIQDEKKHYGRDAKRKKLLGYHLGKELDHIDVKKAAYE